MTRLPRVLVRSADEGFVSRLERDHGIRSVEGMPADCVLDATPLRSEWSLDAVEPVEGTPIVLLYDPGDPTVASRALSGGVDYCVAMTGDARADATHVATAIRSVCGSRSTRGADTTGDPTAGTTADSGDVQFLRWAVDELSDVFFVFGTEMRFYEWNDRLTEVTGYDDSEVAEMQPIDFIAPDDRDAIAAAITRALEEGRAIQEAQLLTKDGREIPYEFTGAAVTDDDGEVIGLCGIGRDITRRRERERALREHAEQLASLDRINGVIRSVLRDLAAAETRAEIEEAVVTRLSAADPYRFAWLGSFEGGERVTPRVWAGEGSDYIADREHIEFAEGDVSAGSAIRSNELQVVQHIADHEATTSWKAVALENGFQSAAAIPLRYRDATVGVLCVYASRPAAFDEDEQAVLQELGTTITQAITAVERRRALLGDVVVELELAVTDDAFPIALSSAGASVTLVGAVPDDDGLRQFYRVEGVDRETTSEIAARFEVDLEFVRSNGAGYVVRTTDDGAIGTWLADRGGQITEGFAEDGEGRLVVQFPPETDVRALLDAAKETHDVKLLARRERPRAPDGGSHGVRLECLTDRQRAVVESAFHAGYFDSPRANTGADVAESLGIATPTFHEHLRAAERKLIAEALEEG